MSPADALLRREMPGDEAAITALLDEAFGGPGEGRLVQRLRAAGALRTSLVAERGGGIAGHAALSPVTGEALTGEALVGPWLGLAPLAVGAACRRRGLGAALVQACLVEAAGAGAAALFVLGEPDYYAALGFEAAQPLGWRCRYDAPPAAFRVRVLDRERPPPPGIIRYHRAFDAL